MEKSRRGIRRGLSFELTSLLDLFMLGVLVFAMNADTAEKRYGDQLNEEKKKVGDLAEALRGKDVQVLMLSNDVNRLEGERANDVARSAALSEQLRQMELKVFENSNSLVQLESERRRLKDSEKTLQNEVAQLKDDYEEMKTARDKMKETLEEVTSGGKGNVILATVFTTNDGKIMWKNNKAWQCCEGGEQNFEAFIEKMSLKDGVEVVIEFVGFQNCAKFEKGLLAVLKALNESGKIGRIHEAPRQGCHLIYKRNGKICIDTDTDKTQGDIEEAIRDVQTEDRRKKATYYVLWPAGSDNTLRAVEANIRSAYGDDVEVEVVKY